MAISEETHHKQIDMGRRRPGGTLTLTGGSLAANIQMAGVYTNSDFALAPDSGTGTLVKFV
jgi:hypothetical protein